MRNAHVWTAKKLDFLELYMPQFIKATAKARTRHYVDGFAGPGLNRIEGSGDRAGSPLIALNLPTPFTDYHFVEQSKNAFASLRTRVESHERRHLVRTLTQGDFNEHVGDILAKINPRAPTLFFLDPEGLELEFGTVRAISERTKADVFVLVSGSGVTRNVRNPAAWETITKFYGDEEWKTIEEKMAEGRFPVGTSPFEAYTDLYVSKLQGLGFTHVKQYLLSQNSKKVPMHALVFAVKSDKQEAPLRIAESILDSLNRGSQARLPF